jgi:acyl-ACP thioesterase
VEPVVDTAEYVRCPEGGRRFVATRRVRGRDVSPSARLKLDVLAGFLQDVAGDDVDDVGIIGAWVLRRVALRFGDLPVYAEEVELATFCSGTGSRWAERRTTVTVGDRVAVEAVAVWVYLDRDGRPAPLEDWFFDWYGSAADGRTVSSRLRHGRPAPDAHRRPWPLRRTDFDVLGHVNNTASWHAVEEEIARVARGRRLLGAEIEYRAAVDEGDELELVTSLEGDQLWCWLTCGGEARTSAVVEFGQ